VVLTAHRLERGPVSNGVGVFSESFSVADGTGISKSAESRSKPSVGWRPTPGEFGDDRCIFIKCNQKGAE